MIRTPDDTVMYSETPLSPEDEFLELIDYSDYDPEESIEERNERLNNEYKESGVYLCSADELLDIIEKGEEYYDRG